MKHLGFLNKAVNTAYSYPFLGCTRLCSLNDLQRLSQKAYTDVRALTPVVVEPYVLMAEAKCLAPVQAMVTLAQVRMFVGM